jgi:hypothetical protein
MTFNSTNFQSTSGLVWMQNARDRLINMSSGTLSNSEQDNTSLHWSSLRPLSLRYNIHFFVPQSQNTLSTKEYEVKMEVKWKIGRSTAQMGNVHGQATVGIHHVSRITWHRLVPNPSSFKVKW